MDLFVLDTDILTLFQRSQPALVARVAEHSAEEIAVTVVSVEEQLSGWYAQLRKAKKPDKLIWAYRRRAADAENAASSVARMLEGCLSVEVRDRRGRSRAAGRRGTPWIWVLLASRC